MQQFEYKVVAAPRRGEKTKGARTVQERFAHALSTLMNDLGKDGWEYLRSDTLPCEERIGLTGRTTVFQNMLVFRRVLAATQPMSIEAPLALPLRAVAITPAPLNRPNQASSELPASIQRPSGFRKLLAEAPVGEAPRITLVAPRSEMVTTIGAAPGNGLSKA